MRSRCAAAVLMSLTTTMLVASGTSASGLGAPASAAPAAQPQAPLPPDLIALEQKMAAVHFNTERTSLQIELQTKEGLLGHGTPSLVLLLAGSGQAATSPPGASFTLSFLGQTTEVRQVDGVTYTYQPQAAKTDGGRSWVRSEKPTSSSAIGEGPTGLGEVTGGGTEGDFAKTLELLNSAQAVQESGPAIVDDQPVTEFVAQIDPTKLAGWSKLLSSPSLAKELQSAGPPSSRLELFISPAGIPLRTRFNLQAGGTVTGFTTDVLALEVPVDVQAPPAHEVIGEARLKTIEKQALARARVRLRRTLQRLCPKLPPKQAAKCRRQANAKPGPLS